MCSALQVSMSGFYRWRYRKPSARSRRWQFLLVQIQEIHEQNHKRYGYRRIHNELEKKGLKVCMNTVRSIMKVENIRPWYVKKRRKARSIQPESLAAPNRIKQKFKVGKLNSAWLADMTEIETPDGKLYLSIVEDMGSRMVVGYAMSTRITAVLPLQALRNALKKRGFPKKLTIHSDQGSQYRSKVYQKELKKHAINCSMSRRGNCYDNAPMESFFATIKRELDLKKLPTREGRMQAIFEFIEMFYNRKRAHSSLKYKSPKEYENTLEPKKVTIKKNIHSEIKGPALGSSFAVPPRAFRPRWTRGTANLRTHRQGKNSNRIKGWNQDGVKAGIIDTDLT